MFFDISVAGSWSLASRTPPEVQGQLWKETQVQINLEQETEVLN